MLTLAQMNWSQWFLAILLIVVCCVLMLVILLQRGRGGGLSAAFGGGGGSSAFGAKTGDVFTWITVVVVTVFILLSVVANFAFDQSRQPPTAPPPTTVAPVEVPEPEEGPPAPIEVMPVEPQTTEGGSGAVVPVDGEAGPAGAAEPIEEVAPESGVPPVPGGESGGPEAAEDSVTLLPPAPRTEEVAPETEKPAEDGTGDQPNP